MIIGKVIYLNRVTAKISTLYLIPENDDMETRKTTALTTVITGLKKFTNYSLQVLAFTKVGDGILTATTYCQTDEDGKFCITDYG